MTEIVEVNRETGKNYALQRDRFKKRRRNSEFKFGTKLLHPVCRKQMRKYRRENPVEGYGPTKYINEEFD